MGEIPTQHLEVMAESFRHDGLNWHHVVIRATLYGIADLRARLLAAEKAREAWTETARMHAKNEAYYRDLIVRTLSGTPAAFVSDDGSVQQDVICAKLPELYEASEKAREEADAYAGRANARIADLGERLDATEAVLRAAESRASSLSRELLAATKARNCADERAQTMRLMLDTIEGWATGQPGKMPTAVEDGWSTALSAAVARLAAAESRAARLAKAGAEFASQYGASAFGCRYDNSCDDSGREPRCEPCELRAAIAAEEGRG